MACLCGRSELDRELKADIELREPVSSESVWDQSGADSAPVIWRLFHERSNGLRREFQQDQSALTEKRKVKFNLLSGRWVGRDLGSGLGREVGRDCHLSDCVRGSNALS